MDLFLVDISIKARMGEYISSKGKIENGTPQGSAIRPLLFTFMTNDVF